jgi:hypothetical protein
MGKGEGRTRRRGDAEGVGAAISGSEAAGYGRERDRVGAHSPDLLSSRGRRAGPGLAVMVGRQTLSHRSPAAANHPRPSTANPARSGTSSRSLRTSRFKTLFCIPLTPSSPAPLRGLCVLRGSKAVLHPPAPLCTLRGPQSRCAAQDRPRTRSDSAPGGCVPAFEPASFSHMNRTCCGGSIRGSSEAHRTRYGGEASSHAAGRQRRPLASEGCARQ